MLASSMLAAVIFGARPGKSRPGGAWRGKARHLAGTLTAHTGASRMAKSREITVETGKETNFEVVEVKVAIRGTRPLLMHNGQLTDPLCSIVQQRRALTSKTKGARDGLAVEEQLARLEFEGGLYVGLDGLPVIPGENIVACIEDGGTLRRKGRDLKRSVRCLEDVPLKYAGMERIKSVADLLANYKEFSLRKRIVNDGGGATMRTRPRFNGWSLSCTLYVTLGGKVDLSDVRSALETAGALYGLGDWHGNYGLFVVEKFAS